MTLNILLIDDDANDVLKFSDAVKEINIKLKEKLDIKMCSENFETGLKEVERNFKKYDLIFLDLINDNSLKLDGNEILKKVYELYGNILDTKSIILTTKDIDFHFKLNVEFTKFSIIYIEPDVLSKPFTTNELLIKIKNVIKTKDEFVNIQSDIAKVIASLSNNEKINFEATPLSFHESKTSVKTKIELKDILFINKKDEKIFIKHNTGNEVKDFIGPQKDLGEIEDSIGKHLLKLYKNSGFSPEWMIDEMTRHLNTSNIINDNEYKMYIRLKGIIICLWNIHLFEVSSNKIIARFRLCDTASNKITKSIMECDDPKNLKALTLGLNNILVKSKEAYKKFYY